MKNRIQFEHEFTEVEMLSICDQFSEKINLGGLFGKTFFFITLPTYVSVFKIQNLGPPQSVYPDIQLILHRQVKCTKFIECGQIM